MSRKYNLKKALIIGGAGFIGSHLVKKLNEEGYTTSIYDAFLQFSPPIDTHYNECLRYRLDKTKTDIIQGSIENTELLKKVILEKQPTHIVNLACKPMVEASSLESQSYFDTILEGNKNCLEIIKELKSLKKYLFVSSSMVYGSFSCSPCTEDSLKRPVSIYGGFKLASEIITETYGRLYDIPYSIVRPSSVYGPGDNNKRVYQKFIEDALNGQELQVYFDGKRDSTYIDDLVEGMFRVLTYDAAKGKTYNISRGEGSSLEDGIKILKTYFPELKVDYHDMKNNRPIRGALGIEKAKKELGYKPQYSLKEGLKKYVEWYTAI